MIKPEVREFDSHPGQNFALSLCGPKSCVGPIPSVGLTLAWHGLWVESPALYITFYYPIHSENKFVFAEEIEIAQNFKCLLTVFNV